MRKSGAFVGMLVLGCLLVQAHAATTTTQVIGALGRAEQTCLSPIPLFTTSDCAVAGWPDLGLAFADAQWGPLQSSGFYATGNEPTTATGSEPGDGKANLAFIDGSSISIDDNGTPGDPGDDLVSFTLVLEDGVRNSSTSGGSMNESFTSMTHRLINYPADSESANGFGGIDYVIGSAGMVIDPCTPDLAGMPGTGGCLGESEYGSTIGNDPLLNVNPWTRDGFPDWAQLAPLPSNVDFGGAGSNNNTGAEISTTIVGYNCEDTGGADPDCDPIDGIDEDGSAANWQNNSIIDVGDNDINNWFNDARVWNNLIMTISTDASGRVVSAKGFYVLMYDVILGGDNSWIGGSFSLERADVLPVATDDPTNEILVNSTVSIDVLANDTDLDDQPLTVNIVTPPTVGTAVVNAGAGGTPADIRIDYTLVSSGGNTTDSFTYEIVDDTPSTSNTATVTIQIVSRLPEAIPDTVATDQDATVNIDVLANDALLGSLGDTPITGVTVPGAVTNGTATPEADNTITFVPTAAFIGTGSFDYILTDFDGSASTATVTVNIVDPNTPTASDDTISVDVGATVAFNVYDNDAGLNDTDLTLTLEPNVSAANASSALVQANCNTKATCTVTYVSNGTPGEDTFDYEIVDLTGGDPAAIALVTIVVNDLPVANDDFADINGSNAVNISVLANDTGLFDTPLVVSFPTSPANGTLSQAGCTVPGTCVVTYTPSAGSPGGDSFEYLITDANGDASGVATVTINDLPIAVADAATADSGGFVNIAVLENDGGISDEPLTVIVTAPANGSAVVNGSPGPAANISVTYTNSGAPGIDTFSYTVTDADGDSDNSSVAIAVSDPNVPLPVDDTAETSQDTAVIINILSNDTGLDDIPITVIEESAPGNGTVTISGSPGNPVNINVTYTPDTEFTGTDSFVYRVTDSNGDTDTATVTITVTMDEIVITIPGGSSSFGPWGLALLMILAVPVLRRRWADSIR